MTEIFWWTDYISLNWQSGMFTIANKMTNPTAHSNREQKYSVTNCNCLMHRRVHPTNESFSEFSQYITDISFTLQTSFSTRISCTVRFYWAGTSWANERNFVRNHAPGAGSNVAEDVNINDTSWRHWWCMHCVLYGQHSCASLANIMTDFGVLCLHKIDSLTKKQFIMINEPWEFGKSSFRDLMQSCVWEIWGNFIYLDL